MTENVYTNHLERAERALQAADDYVNRDNLEHSERQRLVDYRLRVAQVEATIAVAQRFDYLVGFLFDEGRAVNVTKVP